MQLLCNGVVLDLYENTGFQLKDENPLFAFDKIACERTTNFKLPSTPTNDRVLSLSRIPAYNGEGMRRKFSAQLQAGTVVKDGYLYVSSFDGKDYNAIFVTGELLGLQQIKDLGKLNEIMEYTETISASYSVKPSNDATFKTSVFDVYRYEGSEGSTIYPSINVGKLIDKICAHIGVQCATPEKTYEMRLACPSLRVPEKIEGAHIKSTRTGEDPYNTIFADLLARGVIEERVLVARRTLVWHKGYSVTGNVLETQTYDVNVAHFRTLDSIAITFPEDFPEGLFLCYMNTLVAGQCVFLGDYSFTRPTPTTTGEASVVVSGEPLAGRTVEIPAGTSFILVREDGYAQPNLQNDYQCNAVQTWWGDDAIPAVLVTRGWDFVNGLQYDYEVDVDFNEEGATVYRLQDNLPDITFVELLKAVAAELGLVLRYSDADGLTFDVLPIDTYSVLEVGQIMKRGEVTRTFADYAQRNAVRYKEDDVFANNETPAIYTIDNDNISEEKDLQVLPWTNGGQYISTAGVVVWDKAGRSEFLEIRYNAGGIAALRASISKNESIQRLCDASTQIKIESRMPLLQYERLKPDTGLLVDNLTYLWTDKQWQKDIAKLTLAKITLNHYGLTEETIRVLVSQYGENVVLDILDYVKQYPAIVPYINDNPDIAVYTCNIIQPDDNYPYPVTGRAEIIFPNIVATNATSVRFGYKLMQATGEIIPLYFGIYGMQHFCYAIYNYNSNPNRVAIYHGNGTSGRIVAAIMQGLAIGDYIEQYITHSALRVTAGGATEQTTYSGTWRGNPLGLMYSQESANNARIYHVQVYEGNTEEHRIYRLPDGQFWNSIKGRLETTS